MTYMISKKSAKLIGFLPKPLVCFIAKRLINGYISKYANITVINSEVLERINGPVIFISNHLSNSDGLVLDRVFGSGKVHFVAGTKLADNNLTKLGLDVVKTIPINPNTADRSAISKAIKLLNSGQPICIFPEGTRSRVGSMIEGKKGVLLIARIANVPMVPVGIEGTEILMPINDKDMGKERFYPADVKVTLGEPFRLLEQEENESKGDYEKRSLEYVMNSIARLLSPKYRGVYGGK